MKSINILFKTFPMLIISSHFKKACDIKNQLDNGVDYQVMGGKKLQQSKNLIRFKLGEYRLIFKRTNLGFIPEALIQRKNLIRFLKRR